MIKTTQDNTENNSDNSMSEAQRIHLKNLSEKTGTAAPSELSKEEASERIDKLEEEQPSSPDRGRD